MQRNHGMWGVLLYSTGIANAALGAPMSTVTSFQGRVTRSAVALNETVNLRLTLFDAASGGNIVGGPITANGVPVVEGLFTANIDFGGAAFDGAQRWMQIEVQGQSEGGFSLLAPRQSVAAAPMAATAGKLRDTVKVDDLDAVTMGGSGSGGGLLEIFRDLGGGLMRRLAVDAANGYIAASDDNGTAPLVLESASPSGSSLQLTLDDAGPEMRLQRWVNTIVNGLSSAGTLSFRSAPARIEASSQAQSASLALASESPNGDFTEMLLNDTDGTVTLSKNFADAFLAGIIPPPSVQFRLGTNAISIEASQGVNPADLDFKRGNQVAMRIGEDPTQPGQSVATFGPGGLHLVAEALTQNQYNAIPSWPRGILQLTTHFLSAADLVASSNQAEVQGPANVFELVLETETESSVALSIDVATRNATFLGQELVCPKMKINPNVGLLTANTAGPALGIAELNYVPGDGVTAPQLQMLLDGNLVARWAGRSDVPPVSAFVNAPNYVSGSPANYFASGVYASTIVGGGGSGLGNHPVHCPSPGAACWQEANRIMDNFSGIVAGQGNEADFFSLVGGGLFNRASGDFSVIAGGRWNFADSLAFVGGGSQNFADSGVVAGGAYNYQSGGFSDASGFIGGGANNTSLTGGAVVGGWYNTASGRLSAVGGGELNLASAKWATVPGGNSNQAGGEYSFAAGFNAKVRDAVAVGGGDVDGDQGTFVWADSSGPAFTSDGPNRFLVRSSGGSTIYSDAALTAGVALAAGGGSWSSVSDRNRKENFKAVNPQEVLDQIAALPISTWNYKSQDASIRHMGPMAQDFHAAFGVGEDPTRLTTIDVDGVALAAIQGLYLNAQQDRRAIQERDRRIEKLEAKLFELENQIAKGTSRPVGGEK